MRWPSLVVLLAACGGAAARPKASPPPTPSVTSAAARPAAPVAPGPVAEPETEPAWEPACAGPVPDEMPCNDVHGVIVGRRAVVVRFEAGHDESIPARDGAVDTVALRGAAAMACRGHVSIELAADARYGDLVDAIDALTAGSREAHMIIDAAAEALGLPSAPRRSFRGARRTADVPRDAPVITLGARGLALQGRRLAAAGALSRPAPFRVLYDQLFATNLELGDPAILVADRATPAPVVLPAVAAIVRAGFDPRFAVSSPADAR